MVNKVIVLAALIASVALPGMAQEMAKKPVAGAPVTVIVTHEVKDYAAWRKGFDADDANRAKAGFSVSSVCVDVKNPKLVSVIGGFSSAEAAEAFMKNPKLKEVMETAGVVGKPEVKVLVAAPK
jgi:quinol monooxygenase YgiN